MKECYSFKLNAVTPKEWKKGKKKFVAEFEKSGRNLDHY